MRQLQENTIWKMKKKKLGEDRDSSSGPGVLEGVRIWNKHATIPRTGEGQARLGISFQERSGETKTKVSQKARRTTRRSWDGGVKMK